MGTVYTSMAYINTRRYAEAIYWIDRTEMLLRMYMQKPDARKDYFDEYVGWQTIRVRRLPRPMSRF